MFIIYGTCNHISWYLSSLTKDKDYIVYKKGLDLKSLPISHCVIASDPTKYLTLRNEFLKIYEISGCDGTLNIVHSYFDNFDLFNSLHKSFSHESLILNAYDFKTISFDLFGTLINDKVHLSQSQISYLVSKVLPIADRENYLILRKSCNSSSHYEHPSKTNLSNYYEFIGNKMHFSKKFFKYLESLEINFYLKYLEPIKIGLEILNYLSRLEKPIFIYTDTFHSLATINKILETHLGKYHFTEIIVSSEVGFSKDNVTLNMFKQHQKNTKNKLEFHNHLHIGDNFYSDYYVPKSFGINAFNIRNKNCRFS